MSALRIGFTGASGVGKSNLARWISETYGIPLNPVGSRSIAKAMGFESPYDVDSAGKRAEFQRRLQGEKIEWEMAHESFVTDRTTLDELAYTTIHDVETAASAEYYSAALTHMARYQHVFYLNVRDFCSLDGDPKRNSSMHYQFLFDALLRGMIPSVGSTSTSRLDWHSVEDRKREILQRLESAE